MSLNPGHARSTLKPLLLLLPAVGLCASAFPSHVLAAPQENRRIFKVDQSADCGVKPDRTVTICRGAWSSKTIALFNTWNSADINPHRRLRFPSPDGTKTIVVNGFHVRLLINGRSYWTPFGMTHDAEVAWAPDSTRLFVAWSETGELGPWHVQVYEVADNGLKEIRGVTAEAARDLVARERKAPIPKDLAPHRGYWNALDYCPPDIVGSQWLNGSSEILISALAGPDSGCKYMGDFRVYRIEVATGRIIQSYSATEAHRLFGDDDLPKILDDNDDL